ncbi:MAG: c-type cytochrome [Chitinivibrionales bacterium]|nr:c-type cytochrome [Chitinivibrionales bacterium]
MVRQGANSGKQHFSHHFCVNVRTHHYRLAVPGGQLGIRLPLEPAFRRGALRMLKDYRALLIVSLLFVIALIYSVIRLANPAYIRHQKKYYELTGVANGDLGIKQINVETPAGQLIDRCQTCHMGAINKEAANFPQPLRFHASICPHLGKDPHDLNEIGCVVCHDGNGRAVDLHDAHGEFHMWPEKLLRGKAAQASCAKCHFMESDKDLKGAEIFNSGKHLFIEKACYACHTIDGVSNGKSAPQLTDAGDKFDLEYLVESIVEPTANLETSKMPQFGWTNDSATVFALAIYLKAQRKQKIRDPQFAPVGLQANPRQYYEIQEPSVELGRKLFMGESIDGRQTKGGCINCHSYRDNSGVLHGGVNAPELTYAYRMRGEDYIKRHIINPKHDMMDTFMPSFKHLGSEELNSVVAFLKSLTYVLQQDTTRVYSGKQIYTTYCSSCHGMELDGEGKIAALLDPLPRNFTKHQFVAAYAQRFKTSIKKGIAGTAMPPWENILADEEIDRTVEYIESISKKDKAKFVRYDVSMPQPGNPERRDFRDQGLLIKEPDHRKGEDSFQKFCASCHGKLANGKGPNAYDLEHPLPRNLLNSQFLEQDFITDERLYRSILLGVPGTPMPPHDHLRDQTILNIIAYIREISKDESQE